MPGKKKNSKTQLWGGRVVLMTTTQHCPIGTRSDTDQSDGDWTFNNTGTRSYSSVVQVQARNFSVIVVVSLNMSYHLLMASVVSGEKSYVSLTGVSLYLDRSAVSCYFQDSVFVIQHFYMICQGVDVFLSYLEFIDLCGCVDQCFSSTLKFPAIISLNNFLQSFLSLLSFCYTYYTYVAEFNCVPHFSEDLFLFLHSPFLFIRFHNPYQSIHCSTDSSASSTLQSNPPSKFFIFSYCTSQVQSFHVFLKTF